MAENRGRRPKTGVVFLGGNSEPPPRQLERPGSVVGFPSGVQGEALTTEAFLGVKKGPRMHAVLHLHLRLLNLGGCLLPPTWIRPCFTWFTEQWGTWAVANFGPKNLLIRTQLENASPVWHSSLTVAQTESLESLQSLQSLRAMWIIFQHLDYSGSLFITEADTLEGRRERLAQPFFRHNLLNETSYLHYLLRSQERSQKIVNKLTAVFTNVWTLFCANWEIWKIFYPFVR